MLSAAIVTLFQFCPVITLTGHEDWVRAVHFTTDGRAMSFKGQ